jgi:ComF family protein
MMPTVQRIQSLFLNLVLPPRCPMTGELVGAHGTIDPSYWSTLTFAHSPLCTSCGLTFPHEVETDMVCGACLQTPPPYHSARSILRYDDASAAMILKFKHTDGTTLTPVFRQWMMRHRDHFENADLIIPVPLHRWRLLKRRYNQAALLGAALSSITQIPHAAHLLRRTRHTPSQGRKSKAERQDNIKAAFAVPEKYHLILKDKRIILIDDVYTSGATIHECTRVLLKHGASDVQVLTLAKVMKD